MFICPCHTCAVFRAIIYKLLTHLFIYMLHKSSRYTLLYNSVVLYVLPPANYPSVHWWLLNLVFLNDLQSIYSFFLPLEKDSTFIDFSTLWSSRPVDDRMICLFNSEMLLSVCRISSDFSVSCLPMITLWASHWCCNHCQDHFTLNKIFNLLSFINNGTDDVQPLNWWNKLILRPSQLSCSAINCCDFQNNKLSVEVTEIKTKITLLMTTCLFHFSCSGALKNQMI